MKKLIIMMVAGILLAGCQAKKEIIVADPSSDNLTRDALLHRNDDGQECIDEQGLVKRLVEGERKIRSGAMCVDFGSADQLFLIQVEDLEGQPISDAVMEVRFYFGGRLTREWRGLSASAQGEIRFFSPGYFGPMRASVYLVSAPGFESRMLRRLGIEGGDSLFYVDKEIWRELAGQNFERLKEAVSPPSTEFAHSPLSGPLQKGVQTFYLCSRRIVLRKEELTNPQKEDASSVSDELKH